MITRQKLKYLVYSLKWLSSRYASHKMLDVIIEMKTVLLGGDRMIKLLPLDKLYCSVIIYSFVSATNIIACGVCVPVMQREAASKEMCNHNGTVRWDEHPAEK